QVRIEVRLFRNIAQALPVRDAVSFDGLAAEQNLAAARLDEPGDHLQSSGLAGAIRSQVPRHLARLRLEADILHGRDAGVEFRYVAQLEHREPLNPAQDGMGMLVRRTL